MKGRECRNKILNKKGKSPELDLSCGIMILEPHDFLLFFVSILFSYEKAEEVVRWWAPGLEGCSTNPREEAFVSSSAFPGQNQDKFSNLALPHCIHMQNMECIINFSAVYEALWQIWKEKKKSRKRAQHNKITFLIIKGTFPNPLFYLFDKLTWITTLFIKMCEQEGEEPVNRTQWGTGNCIANFK